jgi:hypothetical protein
MCRRHDVNSTRLTAPVYSMFTESLYVGFAIADLVFVRPMMRVVAVAALVLLLASNGRATELGLPPINSKTLAGSWQGVSPYNPFVYRLEIAANEPSYLVWMWDSHPMMCRLISSEVRNGKVTLRFRPMRSNGRSFDSLTITAAGYADATSGSLTGKLRIKRPAEEDYVENVAFVRPQWVDALPKLAEKSEELLKKAQREKE